MLIQKGYYRTEKSVCIAVALLRALILVALVSETQLLALSTNGFTYVLSGGTVTITSYDCRASDIDIPALIEGLPVTTIQGFLDSQGFGHGAFETCTTANRVTIPGTVTRIGANAFFNCGMTNVLIPNSVIHIDNNAFSDCHRLTQITIPDGVQTIGLYAFFGCSSLTSVVVPDSVTIVGSGAFQFCDGLKSITFGVGVTNIGAKQFFKSSGLLVANFLGNAPSGLDAFDADSMVQVFYRPGTSGWGTNFFGAPTSFLVEASPSILNDSLGQSTNGFGFVVSWATNASVVVESSVLEAIPRWFPISTNNIRFSPASTNSTNGWFRFLDTRAIVGSKQYYRIRW